MHPGERVRRARARWGDAEVVRGCIDLLRSEHPPAGGRQLDLGMTLGGLTDRDWLAGGKPPGHAYWTRVWAVRALLYVWAEEAAPAVVAALDDEMWRVRELAAKVVLARELAEAADVLAACTVDPVPRVRIAAARALAAVGEAEHAKALREMRGDPEQRVAAAGRDALHALSRRLDRELS
ncbi:hypothetical protein BH20ACT5_BH20ACT5_01880 [soil metagenome]